MKQLKVLVACEESQTVCKAFRELGHKAFSCDLQNCSGGHPEWHIKGNALKVLNLPIWDLVIAHPPCTYLSNVATRHHSINCTPLSKINLRTKSRIEAMEFFMKFINAPCRHIAVENPVGIMNTAYRKSDQIIEPYQFCDGVHSEEYRTKRTCLWLKGLPLLQTNDLPKPDNAVLYGIHPSGKAKCWEDTEARTPKDRSKTFSGIAKAMAEQWSKYILEEENERQI